MAKQITRRQFLKIGALVTGTVAILGSQKGSAPAIHELVSAITDESGPENGFPPSNPLKTVFFSGCGVAHQFTKREAGPKVTASLKDTNKSRLAAKYATTVVDIDAANPNATETVDIPTTVPVSVITSTSEEFKGVMQILVADMRNCSVWVDSTNPAISQDTLRRGADLIAHTRTEMAAVQTPTDSSADKWASFKKMALSALSHKVQANQMALDGKLRQAAEQEMWVHGDFNNLRIAGPDGTGDPDFNDILRLLIIPSVSKIQNS